MGIGTRLFMIFGSMLHEFLIFSLVSLTEPCSFWYGLKDLFILHRLVDKVVLIKLMTSQDSGRRDVCPHGWLQAVLRVNGLSNCLVVNFS